ncbi:MAG: serine/threonine protein kinase [Akkermansiaceae bacterium]|nr:serine/threonine protein kinase [Akkermansiaceae bacterium]MCP5546074.1 serine/threonine protein kinase [Akkermansiaceae bacterium]
MQAALLEVATVSGRVPSSTKDGTLEVEGFEIIGRLGSGASGDVWLAEEQEPDRMVALKLLRPGSATEEVLQREVRILAKLVHPNLVVLYRSITTGDGRFGLAMEWIDGWPLDEWLERHPEMSPDDRLGLFRNVVRGVAFLHDHGVIHRDLKPANVIVDMQGVPKIVDFGLARLHVEETAPYVDGGSIGICGTLHFMAPEQAANGKGARAMPVDVYALGLMLHHILTGVWLRPPGETTTETLARVLHPPPLVFEGAARQLPEDLKWILRQALSPDPARRYHNARDLDTDLARFAAKQPVSARSHTAFYLASTFVRRQARRSAVAAALVLAGLAAGGVMYQRHRAVAAQNEANLRDAYSLTSFTLRQLRDELHGSTTEHATEPLAADLDLPGDSGGNDPALPVNAAGELDLRYYQALLADLRSATSEGRVQYGPALKSIQRALDLYSELSKEEPTDPVRLLDAARARLSFARLCEKTGRGDGASLHARKTLNQLDRLAVWSGFDSSPVAPLRCDALALVALHTHQSGDSVEAIRICQETISVCESLRTRPDSEWLPRLSLAVSDLATYSLQAGPSWLPDAKLVVHRATEDCRSAYGRDPDSFALACSLARCLEAAARLSLEAEGGKGVKEYFEEAARLLLDHPPDPRSPSIPVLWQISVTATEWARSLEYGEDSALRKTAIDVATRFTTHLRRSGDGRDVVVIQRARLHLSKSRLLLASGDRDAAARQTAFAIELLGPRQARDPENVQLALLTATAFHQARRLADRAEIDWNEKTANRLDRLMEKLADQAASLTARERQDLAKLR